MEKENIPGQMVESIRANGRTICSMDVESIPGLMAENTKVNTKTIKKTVMVFTPGQMARNTMEDGKIASNMVKPRLQIQRVKARKVFGKTETESNGSALPPTTVNQTYDFIIRDIYLSLTVFPFT